MQLRFCLLALPSNWTPWIRKTLHFLWFHGAIKLDTEEPCLVQKKAKQCHRVLSERCIGGQGPRAQLVIIAAQVSPSNGQEGTTMTPHHTILCSQLESTEHRTIPGNPGDNPNKPLCVQLTTIRSSTEAIWLLQCYPCTATAPMFQHQNCLQQPLELVGDQFSDSNFSIISPLLLH